MIIRIGVKTINAVILSLFSLFLVFVLSLIFQKAVQADFKTVYRGPYYEKMPDVNETVTIDHRWDLYPPPSIRGHKVIGVNMEFHDYGENWDASFRAQPDGSPWGTWYDFDRVWSSCGGSPNSRNCSGYEPCFDVCTGGSNQSHQILIEGWENGGVDIEFIDFVVFWDQEPGTKLTFISVEWIYLVEEFISDPPTYSANFTLGCNLSNWIGGGGNYSVLTADVTYRAGSALSKFDHFYLNVAGPSGKSASFWIYKLPSGITIPYGSQLPDASNGIYSQEGGSGARLLSVSASPSDWSKLASGEQQVTVRWVIMFESIEGPGIPVRAAATTDLFSDLYYSPVGFVNVDLSPPAVSLAPNPTSTGIHVTWFADEVGSPPSGFHKIVLKYCDTQSSIHEEFEPDLGINVSSNCAVPFNGVRRVFDNPDDPYALEEDIALEPGDYFVQLIGQDKACAVDDSGSVVTVSESGGGGDPIGDPWLLTAFGDAYSFLGYSGMTMEKTTYNIPKTVDGDAFFSTYIISKNAGSWTSNSQSYQDPDYLLDNYDDQNRSKVADIYNYLHNLYDANMGSCAPQVTVREISDFSDPQDAACSGNSLLFVNNESAVTLPAGWLGQSRDPNRACMIVTKGPLTIPEEVNDPDQMDVLLLSQVQVQVKSEGGGAPSAENYMRFLENYTSSVWDSPVQYNDTSIIIGSDGLPVIAYYPRKITGDPDADLHVVKCLNEKCEGAEGVGYGIHRIVDAGDTGSSNAIVIGTDGNPSIIYQKITGTGQKWLTFVKCTSDDCSSYQKRDLVQITTYKNTKGIYMIADREKGIHPHILYTNPVICVGSSCSARIDLLICQDMNCATTKDPVMFWGTYRMNQDPSNAPYTNLAFDAQDRAFTSIYYLDVNTFTDRFYFSRCVNADCDWRVVSNLGKYSRAVAAFLGGDGTPSFLYSQGWQIGILTCDDPNCETTVSTYEVIPDTVNGSTPSRWISFALGSEGYPVIAYEDFEDSSYNLHVVRCGDISCQDQGLTTHFIADTTNYTGLYNSMAIPDDNRPVIVYVDRNLSRFKVLKCGGKDCNPAGGPSGAENPFFINGSVIANTVDFNRILADNIQNPAEIFSYDPKYLDIFRDCLGESYSFKIREYQYISSGN